MAEFHLFSKYGEQNLEAVSRLTVSGIFMFLKVFFWSAMLAVHYLAYLLCHFIITKGCGQCGFNVKKMSWCSIEAIEASAACPSLV